MKKLNISGTDYRLEVSNGIEDPKAVVVLGVDDSDPGRMRAALSADPMIAVLYVDLNPGEGLVSLSSAPFSQSKREALKEAGLIQDTGRRAYSPSEDNEYAIVSFDLDKLAEYDKEGVATYKDIQDINREREDDYER